MIRVLFVDDEPAVLEGLENRLRRQRKKWKMTFACGVEEAMAALEAGRFEVIVSDVRMPGMDGAEFLLNVRQRWPHMVRLVLSGQSDREQMLRSLPIAHQVLSKPCGLDTLQTAIERAYALDRFVAAPEVREALSNVTELPMLPRLYLRLSESLEDDAPSLRDLGAIVAEDVAVTARLLQVVNSAFFGLARPMVSAEDAAAYLGVNALRSLVLSVELFTRLAAKSDLGGFSLEALQAHSLHAARAAHQLVTEPEAAKVAFSAAMVHDVGRLVLAASVPDYYPAVRRAAEAGSRPLYAVEQEVHGFTHAQAGAYVLSLWGLPFPVVEAVAHHHEPSRSGEDAFGAVGAVHVGETIAHYWEDAGSGGPAGRLERANARLDRVYLERVGKPAEVQGWSILGPDEEPARRAG
jgi:HD-like signal output (HDOD) protein